jgi:hypothetical protein
VVSVGEQGNEAAVPGSTKNFAVTQVGGRCFDDAVYQEGQVVFSIQSGALDFRRRSELTPTLRELRRDLMA